MQLEPTLRPIRLEEKDSAAALAVRALEGRVTIDGPLAETALTVTFTNDLAHALEADLVVPLPESAALTALEVRIGARRFAGRIRPRDRARVEYARAREAGASAALAETEGADLTRMRIAPIAAGEDVVVTITLAHLLAPSSEGSRLTLPLTYMPRYVEPGSTLDATERAALERPRPLTSQARARITVHIHHPPGEPPRVRSPSHTTASASTGAGRVLEVVVSDAPLDRDLALEICDRPRGDGPNVWLRHDATDGPDGLGPTTALALIPPALAADGPTTPRFVTFLVDRSGSMNGPPMRAAVRAVRGALRALEPQDRFNVIAFDTTLEALAPHPVPFDDAMLAAADAFVSSIAARGGTDVSIALAAALGERPGAASAGAAPGQSAPAAAFAHVALADAPRPDARHRLRAVVLMTDGDVAGAEHVLAQARERLADTRLHVLGIGDAVNHAMLGALAALGGGSYTPVASDEDLEHALVGLKNALSGPLFTSVKVTIASGGERRLPSDLEPAGPLDFFATRPLMLAWRGPVPAGAKLSLDGQRPNGEDLALGLPLDQMIEQRDAALGASAGRVWALLRNRRLGYRFDPKDDATLEALGVAYGLANRAVALVAVHPDVRDEPVDASVPVVLPLPRNLARAEPPDAQLRSISVGAAYAAPAGAVMSAMPAAAAPYPMSPPMVQPAPPPPGMSAPRRAPAPASAAPRGALARARVGGEPLLDEAPERPPLTGDAAGLRALMLEQRADGSFAGSVPATMLAVLAFVAAGHSAREGQFPAELRRSASFLRARLANATGDEKTWLALALAALMMVHGDPAPHELDATMAAALAGLSTWDHAASIRAVGAALALAPGAWRSDALAAAVAHAHKLG